MNQYQADLYNNLIELTSKNEAFYFKDFVLGEKTYRIFNYRLASYSDFLNPGALEARGIMFEINDDTPFHLASYPPSKFFNWVEISPIQKLDPNDIVDVMHKMDGCFLYRGHLDLWDGGTTQIGRVVKNKLTPTLIGMNESGEIVPCYIRNWFNNGTKDNWMEITFEYNRRKGHPNKFRLTSNHHLMINGSFKPANTLQIGDLLTHYIFRPSNKILHLIQSSLLGDGSLTIGNGGNKKANYREGHKIEHEPYVDWLKKCLKETGVKKYYVKASGYNNKKTGITGVTISSKRYEILYAMRQKWYPNEKKCLPDDLDWITDFTVAKWYMDDGTLIKHVQHDAATLYTNSFSKADVERLKIKLMEMYHVAISIHDRVGWVLNIKADNGSIHNFWKAIAPYIVPCMRYKLPEIYKSVQFISYIDNSEVSEVLQPVDVKVTNISEINQNNTKFWGGRRGFDITTTTNNYFIGGVLVHNSLAASYLYNGMVKLRTKGSLFSDQAIAAEKFLYREENSNLLAFVHMNECGGFTVSMEYVAPTNRIVIGYEKEDLVILNVRNRYTGQVLFHKDFADSSFSNCVNDRWVQSVPTEYFNQVKDMTDVEGVVVRMQSGQLVKVKCDWYLTLHRTKDTINSPRRLYEAILEEAIDDLRSLFVDDVVALKMIDEMEQKVDHLYNHLVNVVETYYNINQHLTRKEYAIKGQEELEPLYFGLAMSMYTGKPVDFKDFMKRKWKEFGIKDIEVIEQ
ncbi:MAG: hypothetical protein ACREAU_00080 [Nitrosopumilaceae archaeon]